MTLNIEQKNINILGRFETREAISSSNSYRVNMKDGKSFTMICLNGGTKEEVEETCINNFGDRFSHVC